MAEGKKLPQYIAAVILSIGAYGLGAVLGWTSNITDDLKRGELNDLKMSNTQLGWTGSCCNLGAAISCLCIGFLADAIGRKYACLLTVIPFTVGWLCIILANHVYMVYVGRLLTGIGGGGFTVIAPIYTTEISETNVRGRLGVMMQEFIVIGVLHSNICGWAFPLLVFNIINMAIPLIFGILFWFQPETPFYLLKVGKNEAAEKAFKKLRGKDYDAGPEIKHMLEEIENGKGMTFSKFFVELKTKAQTKATIICFMLMFYQQLSGINAIVFYTQDIFMESEIHISVPLAVILTGLCGLVGTTVSIWMVEFFGRTFLLLFSSSLCALACFLIGIFFTLKPTIDEAHKHVFAVLPVIALLLFLFAFNAGLGPIPWLACSELLAPVTKAKLSSIAGGFNWILAFLVTRFYLDVSTAIGIDVTFYIFMVISTTCVFFTLFIIPETKNKTYEEILPYLEKFFKF